MIPFSSLLSNNNEEDVPMVDPFNTVQVVTVKVKKGNRLKIAVNAGFFSLPKTAKFTLTVFGPVESPTKMKCDGYFTTENCPRNCEGRGSTCNANRKCTCGHDRGSDFCLFKADKVSNDNIHKVSLTKRYEWKFFKYIPEVWKEGCSLTVTLDDIDPDRAGYLVNVESMPSWSENLCNDGFCPWAEKIDENVLVFKYEDWEFVTKQQAFTFGFFAKTPFPTKFSVRFELTKPEKTV